MHFSNFFPLFFFSASTWHFLPINGLPSFTEPCNRGNTSLRLNGALSGFGCSLMKFKAKCLVILPRGYLSNELMIIDFQFPNKKKTCSLQEEVKKKRKTIKKIGEMAQAINSNSDCWECFHGIHHAIGFYTGKLKYMDVTLNSTKIRMQEGRREGGCDVQTFLTWVTCINLINMSTYFHYLEHYNIDRYLSL